LRLAVHGYRLRVNEIQRTTKGSWMLADTAVGQAVANKECTILQKIHWKSCRESAEIIITWTCA
jgi:hypothetical protein